MLFFSLAVLTASAFATDSDEQFITVMWALLFLTLACNLK
jgi:hypothetical protein